MISRINLQTLLEEVLGSRNVYYQPPESIKMQYPAIVYSRERIDNRHANNDIDKNPDSEIVEKVSRLPFCRFDRHYVADNLNHDVFTIYYDKEITS